MRYFFVVYCAKSSKRASIIDACLCVSTKSFINFVVLADAIALNKDVDSVVITNYKEMTKEEFDCQENYIKFDLDE